MPSSTLLFSPPVNVEGKQVRLRSPVEADYSTLLAMRNDVELQRMLLADPRPNSPADVTAWLERRKSEDGSFFAIIATVADDRCAGFIQVIGQRPPHRVGALGIAVQRDFSGCGYATEAISVTERYTADRGLRKMVLEVRGDNNKAISLYEHLGYQLVGVHRRHYVTPDQEFDVVVMEKFLTAERSQPDARGH